MNPKASSLRKEWHLRADPLDADVAELAKLLPTKRFKMRVRSTHCARVPPWQAWLVMMSAYTVVATVTGLCTTLGPVLWAVGVGIGLVSAIGTAVAELGQLRVPLPWRGHVVVYVHEGHLATVKPGYEDISSSWRNRTCTDLLDEDGIILASLFDELNRGIDMYFARIDVIEAARDAAKRHKELACERATIRAEIESS